MKRNLAPIVLISLFLGLVFDWFFNGKVPGVTVFLYTSLILGFTFYLAYQLKKPLNKAVYWLAPVALFFAAMVFVRANPFLAVINIFIILYILMVVARLSHQPTITLSQFKIYQYIYQLVSIPLSVVGEFFQVLLRSVNNRKATAPKSSYVPIIRGILLSLPILGVFLLLLSSADLVFKEYLTSLVDLSISPERIFQWGLIAFISSVFIGAYAFAFIPSSTPDAKAELAKKKFDLGSTESSIILGSVSVLFFAFVMIQLAYLFGGLGQISSTGYTYAEYARKGFFELIAVAAISLLLILTIKTCTVFRTAGQSKAFKWLSGLLVVEVMVIMLSAHMRLNLYEEAYGFTMLRLLSHLFIVWLASAFVLLLLYIVREKNENSFAFHLFISVLSFFAVINLINPDDFIAKKNIDRFNKVGKLDLKYLGSLSDDAVPTVARLLDHPNKDLQMSTAHMLYQQKQYSDELTNWQSTNVSRLQAKQVFRDNAATIEAGKSHAEPLEHNAN